MKSDSGEVSFYLACISFSSKSFPIYEEKGEEKQHE